MYFAMNLMDAVWPLLIGTWWGLVVLILVFLILHSGVVLREEAYLERKFGDSYHSYKSAVHRYRWIVDLTMRSIGTLAR
jgi:protein-S-isoprenylcysteine O-methyltransferase Ste14